MCNRSTGAPSLKQLQRMDQFQIDPKSLTPEKFHNANVVILFALGVTKLNTRMLCGIGQTQFQFNSMQLFISKGNIGFNKMMLYKAASFLHWNNNPGISELCQLPSLSFSPPKISQFLFLFSLFKVSQSFKNKNSCRCLQQELLDYKPVLQIHLYQQH